MESGWEAAGNEGDTLYILRAAHEFIDWEQFQAVPCASL